MVMNSFISVIFVVIIIINIFLIYQTSATPRPKNIRQTSSDCESKFRAVDEAVAKISIALDPNARPFKSVEDFGQNYCSPFPKWVKSLLDYRSCMKAFPRQILTMIGSSLKRGGKRFCSTDERKRTVVRHSQCFDNSSLPGVRLAMNKAIVAIEYIVQNIPEKDLIPGLCCAYHEMVIQGTADIETVCSKISGPGTGKFMIDGVITASGEAMELLCGQFINMKTCESKAPIVTSQVRAAITKNSPIYVFTPIVSLLNFVKKYDSEIHVQ